MPARLFDEHCVRRLLSLDGPWMLEVPADGTGLSPERGPEVKVRTYTIHFPGVWETIPDLIRYRGQALARKRFALANEAPVRLVFRGVSHTVRVFLDGEEIGGHHNAFTPFALDVPHLDAGEHELVLHISNEHGEISALHVPNDYYNYGGVSRPADIEIIPHGIYIRNLRFVPEQTPDGWRAKISASVMNLRKTPVHARLRLTLAGETIEPDAIDFNPGESTHEFDALFREVEPWSADSPRLYFLAVELIDGGSEKILDDLIDRVGFRSVRVDGERLLINGDPVFLAGFNRHEDHPDFGCALPLEHMRRDLEIMRDLNANAVRTSHYPNDERFLDLCDEMGFYVWEENHARGLSLEQMRHPRFRDQCRDCNNEMLAWHFNHPAIIIWGILNECASSEDEGREMYSEQFAQIRDLDRSRPLTFASCRHQTDICQDLPDICSWNWYFGWYVDTPVAEAVSEELRWIDAHGAGGKPCIASEFGAGGIPGYHDPIRLAKWSEERQLDILRENLDCYLSHNRFCGVFIWQFCDVRVDESWAMTRPRCINDKGVVDGYRRPKMACDLVRQSFASRNPAEPVPKRERRA